MNFRPLLLALLCISGIWATVALVMKLTEGHTSSPEEVLASMNAAPWLANDNATETERREHLQKVIAEINMLDFEQRRRLREGDQTDTRAFFESLTQEEKSEFLKQTVEQHFKSVMKAFNQMKPNERRRFVERAQADMQKNEVEGQNIQRLKDEDEKVFETLVEKGLGAYYEEASAETKLDLAPLLEEMQQRLRNLPGR